MGPTKDAESKLEHATSKQGDAPFSTNALLPRLIQIQSFTLRQKTSRKLAKCLKPKQHKTLHGKIFSFFSLMRHFKGCGASLRLNYHFF